MNPTPNASTLTPLQQYTIVIAHGVYNSIIQQTRRVWLGKVDTQREPTSAAGEGQLYLTLSSHGIKHGV